MPAKKDEFLERKNSEQPLEPTPVPPAVISELFNSFWIRNDLPPSLPSFYGSSSILAGLPEGAGAGQELFINYMRVGWLNKPTNIES